MNKNEHIQNHWMRFKVSTLAASITSLILSGLPVQIQASDIDIYQAGGTGKINLYFMVDTSGSMGNSSLNDYQYRSSIQHNECTVDTERGRNYTSTTSNNNIRWALFKNVGTGKGQYTKSNKDYTFVGTGNGDYILIDDKNNNFKDAEKYIRSSQFDVSVTTCTLTNDICNNTQTLQAGLTQNGYSYADQGDSYCLVKQSYLNTSNTNDGKYWSKIQKICDPTSTSGEYNCLTRLANLKKGFLSLVNSSEINEDHQFAIGQYSGTTASTLEKFMKMDATGKSTISNRIVNLTAGSYTPIDKAYDEASNQITVGNTVSNANPQCSGNGIYFLTDGEPNPDTTSLFTSTKASDSTLSDYFNRMAGKAANLRSGAKLVKTATVGFGGDYYLDSTYARNGEFDCSVYNSSTNRYGLCGWGTKLKNYGKGGFYNAQSAEDLVGSIKQFVSDVSVPIEGTTIGSSTIPVDALNTNELQPFSYFPMFKPMIGAQDQLWVGNLKKYNVINGSLYDITNKAVFKNSTDFNTSVRDYWLNSSVTHPDEVVSYGGNLSQLLGTMLPKLDSSNNLVLQRNVFINSSSSAGDLTSATTVLKDATLTNREYLYGLLGYSKLTAADLTALGSKSYDDQLAYLKTKTAAQGYQLGSIIHSSPILLTQKGAIVADSDGVMGSADREDYVLFGTTQGILHVVKSGTQNTQVTNGTGVAEGSGTEVFSFVPKEMLEKQKNGFFESMAMDRNASGFYYGVDGPWTAHTVYEPNFYDANVGGVTVARDGLQVKANSDLSHQYVYGGLRMGGRSYYGLNLSDISKPKLMFHIDPASATSGALSHMGQSWSKPTVAYIKWNGQRKLAMIVGGGYDTQYEDPTFTNSTVNNVKGNGIYIFDAENGKLLWWGSASATDENGNKDGGASTEITDMVNSIPSRVKTVDRDGDGLVDHIYVGDLGGKIFRVDLNPKHNINDISKKFVLNAFTFADAKESGKSAPRFYEAPTFTMHTNSKGKKFAVISLASGDRSSPLKSESTAQDMILGFYDSGVTATTPVVNSTIALTSMNEIYKAGASTAGTLGWYYRLPKTDSKYQARGLSEGVALDGDLYYSVFDPSKTNNGSNGASTSCSGGIVGTSKAYKLCLPSGVCGTDTKITEVGDLGAGIISLNVGPGTTKGSRKLIFNKLPEDCIDGKCTPKVIDEYLTTNKLLPTRWYDLTPYVRAK